jgi:hypothetical protein
VVTLVAARRASAVELSLWPMAELDEFYDNNVKLTPTNRKGDFVTAESFGATLEASTAARDFFLTYQTQLLEYVSYPGLDRFGKDHAANLRDEEFLTPATTLTISDSLLVGNAVSIGILANGVTPIGTQLMQSLFYQSSTLSNDFSLDLSSRYSDSFTWTANIHQYVFTTLSGTSASSSGNSGVFFDQGGSVGGLWNLPERFAAGFVCQFDDFRSNTDLPTTEAYWPQATMSWGVGTPFSIMAQVGPIVSDSSSGSVATTTAAGTPTTTELPARTQVNVGYFVSGNYHDRRLTVSASASQEPGFGAGFAGYATEQSYGVLANYKLTRRATVFVNGGYFTISGSGVSADVITYTGGMTYRLNEYFTLSANYLGFQTKASGTAVVGTLVAVPGKRSTVNLVQAGITFVPPAFKWRL